MRLSFAVLSLLAGSALLVSGCGFSGEAAPKASGGVAVLDLDEVARQLGASDEISQALVAQQTSFNAQLQSLKEDYSQQLEAKKQELGEAAEGEASPELAAMSRQASLNLQAAQRKAQGHINVQRAKLVQQFRERVAPIAKQVAAERGLSIVVPKNNTLLLSVDEQVDITEEVTTALKASWQSMNVSPETAPSAVQPAHFEETSSQ